MRLSSIIVYLSIIAVVGCKSASETSAIRDIVGPGNPNKTCNVFTNYTVSDELERAVENVTSKKLCMSDDRHSTGNVCVWLSEGDCQERGTIGNVLILETKEGDQGFHFLKLSGKEIGVSNYLSTLYGLCTNPSEQYVNRYKFAHVCDLDLHGDVPKIRFK